MSLKTDVQELIADLMNDLVDEEVSNPMTYNSAYAQSGEIYDPETGTYVQAGGDGALWFDNEDNSHWLAVIT